MVFLLGYLCSPKQTNVMDEASLVAGFDRCLAFLSSYESQSRSAKKCSKILELVKQEVFTDRGGKLIHSHKIINYRRPSPSLYSIYLTHPSIITHRVHRHV